MLTRECSGGGFLLGNLPRTDLSGPCLAGSLAQVYRSVIPLDVIGGTARAPNAGSPVTSLCPKLFSGILPETSPPHARCRRVFPRVLSPAPLCSPWCRPSALHPEFPPAIRTPLKAQSPARSTCGPPKIPGHKKTRRFPKSASFFPLSESRYVRTSRWEPAPAARRYGYSWPGPEWCWRSDWSCCSA